MSLLTEADTLRCNIITHVDTPIRLPVMRLSLLTLTHPKLGNGGDYWDLQKLFDKFPTPGDNFTLQSPYYPLGMRWGFVRN